MATTSSGPKSIAARRMSKPPMAPVHRNNRPPSACRNRASRSPSARAPMLTTSRSVPASRTATPCSRRAAWPAASTTTSDWDSSDSRSSTPRGWWTTGSRTATNSTPCTAPCDSSRATTEPMAPQPIRPTRSIESGYMPRSPHSFFNVSLLGWYSQSMEPAKTAD